MSKSHVGAAGSLPQFLLRTVQRPSAQFRQSGKSVGNKKDLRMRKQGQMDEQAEEGSQIMKWKEWQMDTARRAAYGGQ
jgi:hypothetical protein